MAKVRTDWEALRDALEPCVLLIIGPSSAARGRAITNDLIVAIRGSRPFPFEKYNSILSDRAEAGLSALIVGARAAITSARAG